MTIAVTGATGQLGRLVLAALKKRLSTNEIVALARNPAKVEDLAARPFDYSKPETLAASLQGVNKLLLISSSEVGQRTPQHLAVITAAQQAGVEAIIYTSLLRADSSPLSLAPEHYETEQALKASGIAFTILRNGWYTENYTGSIGTALQAGAFVGSAGDGRISSAARADYAEAAAVVLTTEGHTGKTYELAGDSFFTLADLAAEVSRQTGKTIPYNNLPPASYTSILVGVGIPEGFAEMIAGWDHSASQDALFDEGHQLSKLIGRPTTALRETVRAALQG